MVVDDGNECLLEPVARGWGFEDVRVVRQEHAGQYRAFQPGAEEARGKVVLLGLDDTVPSHDEFIHLGGAQEGLSLPN